jgi:hypothetical protein
MYEDLNNLENYDQDPLENSMLQEMFEAEISHSMRWTYERISKMGISKWFEIFPYEKKRKIKIIENMMLWFADPQREEYEKSAYLRNALNYVKQEYTNQIK